MNATQSIIAFAVAAGLLTIAPGLDTALVLRTAVVEGPRRAAHAGLGICCGVLVWGLAVAVGLGALLAVSRAAYDVLRIVGAVYLLYLGARLILRAGGSRAAPDASSSAVTGGRDRPQGWFARGMLTNLLNPKVGVFYATFLPQFIPARASVIGMSMLLATIHALEGVAWFLVLISAAERLGRWLRRPGVQRGLDRATGGVLILFGARLALARR